MLFKLFTLIAPPNTPNRLLTTSGSARNARLASLGAVIFSNGVPSTRYLCSQELRLDNEDNVNAGDKPTRERGGSLTCLSYRLADSQDLQLLVV